MTAHTDMTPLSNRRIAFIGAGNMATSMVAGLIGQGFDPDRLSVSDPDAEQLRKHKERGVATFKDNNAAIERSDLIVLAVKPQVASAVVTALELQTAQVLVSIAAGINVPSLQVWSNPTQPIVRSMPNTPALLGAGITAAFANEHCDDAQKQAAFALLTATGQALWVEREGDLDAVTAVSGSGPAYYFLLMEAMIAAGTALGLSREVATELTIRTAHGAAAMALEGTDPATLRANVTSPGGTTAAALGVLEDHAFAGIVREAIEAAHTRAQTLAEEFGART